MSYHRDPTESSDYHYSARTDPPKRCYCNSSVTGYWWSARGGSPNVPRVSWCNPPFCTKSNVLWLNPTSPSHSGSTPAENAPSAAGSSRRPASSAHLGSHQGPVYSDFPGVSYASSWSPVDPTTGSFPSGATPFHAGAPWPPSLHGMQGVWIRTNFGASEPQYEPTAWASGIPRPRAYDDQQTPLSAWENAALTQLRTLVQSKVFGRGLTGPEKSKLKPPWNFQHGGRQAELQYWRPFFKTWKSKLRQDSTRADPVLFIKTKGETRTDRYKNGSSEVWQEFAVWGKRSSGGKEKDVCLAEGLVLKADFDPDPKKLPSILLDLRTDAYPTRVWTPESSRQRHFSGSSRHHHGDADGDPNQGRFKTSRASQNDHRDTDDRRSHNQSRRHPTRKSSARGPDPGIQAESNRNHKSRPATTKGSGRRRGNGNGLP